MIKILITGASGQLACCLKNNAKYTPELDMCFVSKDDLNITNKSALNHFFSEHTFDYCVNTAAYTNVEKAESEPEKAFQTNAIGAKNISEACKNTATTLIHISTDYVFDGTKKNPYVESDTPNAINVYGASKLKGEQYIQEYWSNHFIIRTSWLYSQYGHNFFNSMLRLAKEKKALTITTEQTGAPTNANDLAEVIVQIIKQKSAAYGIYHFSNQGSATWYDFAKAIFETTGEIETINLAKTNHYPTFARRPRYSILNCTKIYKMLKIQPRKWKTSLEGLIRITTQP